jgi:hypothetical protein
VVRRQRPAATRRRLALMWRQQAGAQPRRRLMLSRALPQLARRLLRPARRRQFHRRAGCLRIGTRTFFMARSTATTNRREEMILPVPITLWAVAHDTLVDEKFEPIWVWYAALRSCEKGIEMSEDLGGEFGNRERGKASLTQARNELKAWAATQPQELTMYFGAELAQWDENTGNFMMQGLTKASTVRLKEALTVDQFFDGATVELWSDFKVRRQSINHFQASLRAPQCISPDGKMVYKFEKLSQWWVVFGDVDRGAGGLANYKSRELLPAINMTRENAAAFAQRNPERKVEVAVTFTPAGSSFVKGIDQSAIRNKFKQVTVYDALDGSTLATQTY